MVTGNNPIAGWLAERGPGYPLVMSCRARLARDIEGLPFPPAADEEELERARGMVLEALVHQVARERDWEVKFAEEIPREQLAAMAEGHLVSRSFSERTGGRALAAKESDGRRVVVNEEDHLRIQAVLPGNQIMKAWKDADRIDSLMEREIQYSFDQGLGYLTSCPSNAGTGLRVSAMLHLPALVITGEIAKTISALSQAGIYIRGLYGEGSGVAGNLVQISNQVTLGRTEQEIVEYVDRVVHQVVDNERTARKLMLRDQALDTSDRIYRALGIVERARKMGFFEALELVSLLKLGIDMDILPIKEFNMMDVFVGMCPYHLKSTLQDDADEDDVERERAPRLRTMLGL